MASSAIIPEPNADGYYSSVLKPKYERGLIEDIGEVATDLRVIDENDAGNMLFLIWDQAGQYSALSRPPQFSTRELCNMHIQRRPDLVPLLAAVHEKKAYAWLCEYSI